MKFRMKNQKTKVRIIQEIRKTRKDKMGIQRKKWKRKNIQKNRKKENEKEKQKECKNKGKGKKKKNTY